MLYIIYGKDFVPEGNQRHCLLLWWFGMARRHAKDNKNIQFFSPILSDITLKRSTNQLTTTTKIIPK